MKRIFIICLLLSCSANAQNLADTWRPVIDSLWGEGAPTDRKLFAFDTYWEAADSAYAAFHNLNIDWDDFRERYRPEIEAGVSEGRFTGIMNHLALALREIHTSVTNPPVNLETRPEPGVPLLYGWIRGDNGRFGACLTPLPDRSLLVYNAVPEHPLGLQPGDIVLGYDGIAWSEWYRELLAAELPLFKGPEASSVYPPFWSSPSWASAPSAYEHGWLSAAGLNWHLFDMLDVFRSQTGDTLHLPVAPLAESTTSILCTEQLPVAGVDFPDLLNGPSISWGIVEGTRTGYIYVWDWMENTRDPFREAVEALVIEENVEGLIIDFRFNGGGWPAHPNDGFAILFNSTIPTMGIAIRSDPDDRLAMEPRPKPQYELDIPGDPATYFDHPIAVLTGPGAVSAGDYGAIRLGFHPRARFFGKPTAASVAPWRSILLGIPRWRAGISFLNAYWIDEPDQFLSHTELPIDEPIWLTPEAVLRGEDTVVRAALSWISQAATDTEQDALPLAFELSQNYPNPFTDHSSIKLTLPQAGHVNLTLYNALGVEVSRLADWRYPAGRHTFTLDARALASGVYFYVARFGKRLENRKMLVVK